jgi:hypothetical protein
MYIKRFYDDEIWKSVELKSPFSEKMEIQVSNYGNIKRVYAETGVEKTISLGKIEGYPSVSLRVMESLSEKENNTFVEIRSKLAILELEIKQQLNELAFLKDNPEKETAILNSIEEKKALHEKDKTSYQKKYKKCQKKRTKNWGALIHRLVAIYFIKQPSENHNLVAHIDYEKENNHHSNLKWMTRDENTKHQRNSPFVIKAKAEVFIKPTRRTNTKLTEKDVMILKKRMNEEVPLSKLAKRYKVSETQLLRIKRGLNWGKVPAAL